MVKLFANSEDPDQTPHFAASDLGMHCLPVTILGVSRLQWVKFRCPKTSITAVVNHSPAETEYAMPLQTV